jgi:hypothetical protein
MKRFAIVTGICASFLLGAAMTVAAQDEHKDEPRQPEAQPAEHQNEAQPKDAHPEERQSPDRPKQSDEDKRNQQPQSGDRRDMTPQNEGKQLPQSGDRHDHPAAQNGHPEQMQGREGSGRHISDSDFHSHFGREHVFHPGRMQVVEGRPEFAYSGYTFVLVDAWPAGWSYDDDDCYVDYIDGSYYLLDLRHPGVRILLMIM